VSPSPARDPLVGRALGDFVVVERIGAGGFGAVYRAEQPALERQAVIKVLHQRLRSSEVGTQRFLREARLASRLDHPYAAHIYAFGAEADGLLWIAMEMVRGTALDHMLALGGPIPLERFAPLLQRICEVLHTAHEQSIVHRDIKPANVLVLSRAGNYLPKLLDFGIAKLMGQALGAAPFAALAGPEAEESASLADTADGSALAAADQERGLTQRGAIMGSPYYMAPEQWADPTSADARTDLYALGVLAYEALTGQPPFGGKSQIDLLRAHSKDPVPPLGPGFPAALDAVLARAMAKQPADRYASALELAQAFMTGAGLADEARAPLPSLDEAVRDEVMAAAPQPIAEAVALLAAARNAHQARDAVRDLVRTITRVIGIVALACRSRAGGGPSGDSAPVVDALRSLRRHALGDQEWIDLARELCRPFAELPDAHPIPELVALFFATAADAARSRETAADDFLALPAAASHTQSEDQVREQLEAALPVLTRLLRSIAFLADYPLVVSRGGLAEMWMGVRRPRRAALAVSGRGFEPDRPALADRSGRPVLLLWPLAQIAEPAPGAAEEMFLFDGKGRRGARFLALPAELERHDDAIWDWFGAELLDTADQPAAAGEERSPYRGLAAYGRDDADTFVGREREVDAFLNRLRTHAFLAVVGPSGAGKSSFIQAGVVPALPDGWRALRLRPGPSPMSALGAALEDWADGAVLVVDQLEELFTMCRDPAEREAFAAELARLSGSPDEPARVIVTLRDDFLLRLQSLEPLGARLASGLQLLNTPARADLLRILIEPARRAGYDFDDRELPEQMVDEVVGLPSALPLLSFAAARLWEMRDRHFKQLTRKAHDALGGVGGALAQHAEATLAELGGDDRRLVREAFRHLVTGEGTRAVLTRSELFQLLGGESSAERVVERLVAARLLAASDAEAGEQIEVVHEALLATWPRLVDWQREDAEGVRLRDQLRSAARQWQERGRPRGLLWRDEALAEYKVWRSRYPGALTEVEQSFGRASLAEADRGRRLKRRTLIAAFAALAVGLTVMFQLRRRAEESSELAHDQERKSRDRLMSGYEEQGRRALLDGDSNPALVYFDAAAGMGMDTPALRFMVARAMEPLEEEALTVQGHRGQLWGIAYSPDGGAVLTAGDDGVARVWDAASGRQRMKLGGHPAGLLRAVWSPDGKTIATGGADGAVHLWRADGGSKVADLEPHAAAIYWLVFDAGGHQLASASEDGVAHVWDLDAGRLRARIETGAGSIAVQFDPAGSRLVTAGTRNAIWSRDGRLETELVGHRQKVWVAAFDPAGRYVATGSLDGTARLWDAASGRLLHVLGHEQRVTHVGFAPDGGLLATASADRSVRLWDVETGEPRATLRGHTGQINRVAFTADGAELVSASADGTARVWDVPRGVLTATLFHGGFLFDVAIAPDGRQVATSSWLGTAKFWRLTRSRVASFRITAPHPDNLPPAISADGGRLLGLDATGATLWTIGGETLARLTPGGGVAAAALHPSGARIAIGQSDGSLLVAEAPGWSLREIGRRPGGAVCAEYDPPGRRLVSCGADGTLVLQEVASGAELRRTRLAAPVGTVRFSRDGAHLVALPADGSTPTLLSLPSFGRVGELGGHAGQVQDAAFSPDGRYLATSSTDGKVRIWSTSTGAPVTSLAHGATVWKVAWSPSTSSLAAGGYDGSFSVWSTGDWALVTRQRGHDNYISGLAVSPDGAILVTASGDRTVKFWDTVDYRPLYALSLGDEAATDLRFVGDGRRLLSASSTHLDLWNSAPGRLGARALHRFVECRVPLVLSGGRLLEATPKPCAD